ncbi:MAG: hypothetical protein HYX75_16885 [Acidobacteria bacterium]|nr:hypothetical protein [Acidobacteriota bacterium]
MTVKRRLFLLVGSFFLVASIASAARNSSVIATGPHDLSAGSAIRNTDPLMAAQTCIFCHTPHGGNYPKPLWNRNNTTSAYQLYSSSTMDASQWPVPRTQRNISGACLSCHDGSIAIDTLINFDGQAFGPAISFDVQTTATATYGNAAPGVNNLIAGGPPLIGTDLRIHHPITIIYEEARSATPAELVQPVEQTGVCKFVVPSPTGYLPLAGRPDMTLDDATVECISCHEAHNNQYLYFLRKPNTNSDLCLTCHVK